MIHYSLSKAHKTVIQWNLRIRAALGVCFLGWEIVPPKWTTAIGKGSRMLGRLSYSLIGSPTLAPRTIIEWAMIKVWSSSAALLNQGTELSLRVTRARSPLLKLSRASWLEQTTGSPSTSVLTFPAAISSTKTCGAKGQSWRFTEWAQISNQLIIKCNLKT